MFLLYGRQYPVLWAPLHDADAEGSPYTRKESMLVYQRSLNRESWTEDIADSLNWTWCSVVPTSRGHSGLFSFFFFAELIPVSSRPHRVPLSSVPADTVSTRCNCLVNNFSEKANQFAVGTWLGEMKTVTTYSDISGETSCPRVLKMQLSTCLDTAMLTLSQNIQRFQKCHQPKS